MYQHTSRLAFEGNKTAKHTMCIEMLGIYRNHGNLTDEMFKEISGWEINQVTARRNDLLNKIDNLGKPVPEIELKGKTKNSKGRTVNLYGVKYRKDLFE